VYRRPASLGWSPKEGPVKIMSKFSGALTTASRMSTEKDGERASPTLKVSVSCTTPKLFSSTWLVSPNIGDREVNVEPAKQGDSELERLALITFATGSSGARAVLWGSALALGQCK
jgi:hypothetical protein